MKKTFFISTPIYYASGKLHIGHAYTTTICDAISRYKKMRGYDVFYLTGSDEHGEKVQQKAKEQGITPKQYTDKLVENVKALWKTLDIDYDKFIRTTDDYHEECVSKIFSYLLEKGDIYKSEYEGWYCTPCESFWTESQLDEEHNCPDCGLPCHKQKEEAYFFRMSKYADQLMKYYDEHPGFIEPESRKNEMVNNFLKKGLEDLCVTRTSFDWGVPVKEDPRHVIYVWIDALANYISALGYNSNNTELFDKYWKNDEDHEVVHIVGKEIVRFHVIYWPIMLMALGLPLPTKIYAHGWIVMKGGKMSKSKGNVIYPETIIDRYGLDALRYFVSSAIPFGSDGLFTPELFIENFNKDLVNNYGNLVSRTVSMILKYFDGVTPDYKGCVTEFDKELEVSALNAITQYEEDFDKFQIHLAIKDIFNLLDKANKYIDDTKPWALAKDKTKQEELKSVMNHLMNIIKVATVCLQPILVNTVTKVFASIGKEYTYEDIKDFTNMNGNVVSKGEVLFPRLDVNKETEYLNESMK